MIRDLTEAEARRALVLKWGEAPEGVLPAWVAEMDYACADVVTDAVERAELDLDELDRLLDDGAPTLILTQTHTPQRKSTRQTTTHTEPSRNPYAA